MIFFLKSTNTQRYCQKQNKMFFLTACHYDLLYKTSKQHLSAHKTMHPCKLLLTLTLAMHIHVCKPLTIHDHRNWRFAFFMHFLNMQRTWDKGMKFLLLSINLNFNSLYINEVDRTHLTNGSETVSFSTQNGKNPQTIILKSVLLS